MLDSLGNIPRDRYRAVGLTELIARYAFSDGMREDLGASP
jgi:hypothetical protein